MFSRRGRKKDKSYLAKKDWILIVFLFISLLLFCFLSFWMIQKIRIKQAFYQDIASFSARNEKDVFSLDHILLFSSCDAIRNDTKKALWDLSLYQYTDIAIYLNNHLEDGLTQENTIKRLWIDHIEYGIYPELGTPSLYYKDSKEFGKSSFFPEKERKESIVFSVIDTADPLDTSKPMVYESGQTPITLEFVNQNIKTNAIISNTNTLVFDGSLLAKANIPINSIRTSLSFRINIENNKEEKFVCVVSFEIPLQNSEEDSMIKGSIQKTLDNLNHYKFYKLEKGEN